MIETSCSKKVAEKSVILKLSTNAHSESDKENTPDMIGNEKYNFLFGSDDTYSDYDGFVGKKYCPLIPTLLPLKIGVTIKIQMNLQMFTKTEL